MKRNWHGIMGEFDAGGGSGGDAGAQPQAQAAPQLDYDKMGQTLATHLASALPQPQPQAPQVYKTQEDIEREYRQRTHYPTYNEQALRPLFGDSVTPEQAQHFQTNIIEPLLKHVFATNGLMLNYQLQDLQQRYDQRLTPILSDYEERRLEKGITELTGKYSGLKGQEQAVKMVINGIQAQGLDLSKMTREQRMEFVANQTANLLRGSNPNFSLQTQPNQNAGGGLNGMLNGGSGGASGGGGGQQSNKKAGMAIFD
jgi:hypothetical protein